MQKHAHECVRDVVAIVRDLLLCVIMIMVIATAIAVAKTMADRLQPAAAPAEVVHVRQPNECRPGELFDWSGKRC